VKQIASWVVIGCIVACANAQAVTVEKLISRESPDLEVTGNSLTVGRDRYVYLARGSYVLRLNADGTGKIGGKGGWANCASAVNSNGVIALASAHMSQSVRLLTPQFDELASIRDFYSNDQTLWLSPCDVQTGPSGNFYAMDQFRNRIVRIAANGKMLGTNSIASIGENFTGTTVRLRVVESLERFYVATPAGDIHAIGFDGRKIWTIKPGISGDQWQGYLGDFDADDDGNLYILRANQDTIEVFDKDSQPTGKLSLEMGNLKGENPRLRLGRDAIYVKRDHKTEMFQIYDRATGKLRHVIHADVEYARMEYPGEVWTAGQAMPFAIKLESPTRKITPAWPVRIARYNDSEWIDLPVVDGKITPPVDAAGLYLMRTGYGEYRLEAVVEIRKAGSKGTVNILTPLNRVYYGRGEEIPVKVIVRGPGPDKLKLELRTGSSVVWSTDVSLSTPSLTIPADTLPAGKYLLTADVPGLTVVPQNLVIGPGFRERSPFKVIHGGDNVRAPGEGSLFDAPTDIAVQLAKAQKTGINMFMDRLGNFDLVRPPAGSHELAERLKKDPLGVAPEKAQIENFNRQFIASRGAFGIEEHGILFYMDTMLPFLKEGVPNPGGKLARRHFAESKAGLQTNTVAIKDLPAFRGWSWACNWWIDRDDAFRNGGVKEADWKAARDKALKTGQWDAELERISDLWVNLVPQADKDLTAALHEVAPGKVNAVPGPYRHPSVIPSIAFKDAGEVDCFLQAEQIQMPFTTHHNVDFYKRPGKRVFGHCEIWNEDGTGNMALPTMLQQAVRGAVGTGWEGVFPGRSGFDNDARSTMQGAITMQRTLSALLRAYGPWLTTLAPNDHLAIVVSTRMMRLDEWEGQIGGRYFERMYEVYNACHYAHRPATFVHTEDVSVETLKKFKAVLVVGQRVELDPPLAQALKQAQAAGVAVFHDGTCRTELVSEFKPLNVTFDRVEKDPHLMNDDSAYYRAQNYYKKHAAALVTALGSIVPPVAGVDNPEILLTERRNGEGRFVWALNNDVPDWEPGLMWRVGLFCSHRIGQLVPIDLNAKGQTVYELFAQKQQPAAVVADLRQMPVRLFAVVPKPIESVKLSVDKSAQWKVTIAGPKMSYPLQMRLRDEAGEVIEEWYPTNTTGKLTLPATAATLEATELISGKEASANIRVSGAPPHLNPLPRRGEEAGLSPLPLGERVRVRGTVDQLFGPHLRDVAVSANGSSALINAMNWDDNFYVINSADGAVKQQGSVGHHWAYGPVAAGKGFFLQGYDLATPEGYHLYDLGSTGKPERRFGIFGTPQRGGAKWASYSEPIDRINSFVVSPKGNWIANAGNMGLIVWSRNGKALWSEDWSKTTRKMVVLVALGDDTLVALHKMTATAYHATTGRKLWELTLDNAGVLQGGAASADGRTLAVYSDTDGVFNRPDFSDTFVIRDGKLINRIHMLTQDVVLTADGRFLALNSERELFWYAADGVAQWSFKPDEVLHNVRISPDGKKLVLATDLGTLYVLDDQSKPLLTRDCGAIPVAQWLTNNELLVATWTGDVMRMTTDGAVKWQVRLRPKGDNRLAKQPAADSVTTVRAPWFKTEESAPLTPNLLVQAKAVIRVPNGLQNPQELLTDGHTEPSLKPWMSWTTVSSVDSGWVSKVPLEIESPNATMRVAGITIVEDPAHPESWMKDAILQIWEPVKGVWEDGAYLSADSVTHTHRFEKPLVGSKFRFIGDKTPDSPGTGGWGWPVGNLRMAELVFHGEMVAPPPATTIKP